jgi:tetratricopeptide (TPR) repeat protein
MIRFPYIVMLLLSAPAWGESFEWRQYATHAEADAVVAHCTQNIEAGHASAADFAMRGNALFELRQFDEAIEDFTRAIELDDELDLAWFGRGMALGRNRFISEGISDLSVYIKRNPASSLAYTKRGVRYILLGDMVNAERDLGKALELDPGNAEAHDDIGVILARRKDYQPAIDHFLTTIKLDPTYQKAYHNLAMSYYLTGQDQNALVAVDESLRLRPTARSSLMLKGHILRELGRQAEAEELLEEAEFLEAESWSEGVPVQ